MTSWREEHRERRARSSASTCRSCASGCERDPASRSSTCASGPSGTTGTSRARSTSPYHDVREVPEGIDPARPSPSICSSGQRSAVAASLLRPPRRPAGDPRRRRRRRHLGAREGWPVEPAAPAAATTPSLAAPRAGLSFLRGGAVDLNVVCKNCGSEVSPYITECPYCGQRLRKRAPKLSQEGEGVELAPAPKRRRRLRRAAQSRASERRRSPGSPRSGPTRRSPSCSRAQRLPRRPREQPRPLRPRRDHRAARRRLVAAGRGAVRLRERRLPVRGRRRGRDLRHQPRAPLRRAGAAARSSSAAAPPACTWRPRSRTFPIAIGGNGSALGLLCAWLVRDLRDRRAATTPRATCSAWPRSPPCWSRCRCWSPPPTPGPGLGGAAIGCLLGLLLPERS